MLGLEGREKALEFNIFTVSFIRRGNEELFRIHFRSGFYVLNCFVDLEYFREEDSIISANYFKFPLESRTVPAVPGVVSRDPSTIVELRLTLLMATSGEVEAEEFCVSVVDVVEGNDGDTRDTVSDGNNSTAGSESLRNVDPPGVVQVVALSLSAVVSHATCSPVSAKTNLLLARRFNIVFFHLKL